MKLELTGKVALVTGGSRGIGRACSLLLALAGARVVVNYQKSREKAEEVLREIAQGGGEAHLFQADVADPEQIEALFRYIRETFGRLDILVNNAGLIKDNLLLTMGLSDWEKVHDVSLKGAFLTTRRAAEMMLPNHAGKIINMASVSAIRGGRGQTNYASAKGGLLAFTRACAVELAGKGIQVNAVLPGVIVTDMTQRIRKRAGEMLLKNIPSERFGDPMDVAHLVLFLASEKSDYITGQAIAVDGGLSVS
jgi:3-oxoacyl-[acyl-carrier protein] reductase